MILLLLTMIVGTYGADKFSVSGKCTTTGACFQSPNYPNDYGASEQCEITVQSVSDEEMLFSLAFNTELDWDILIVKGKQYSGTSGPSNVEVAVDDVFNWSSDDIEQRSGFEVCLARACLETNGSQTNAGACRCGTALCSSSTGLFCTSLTNTCRHAACSVADGSSVNAGNCACGTSDCTSSNGLFCTSSINTCHLVGECLETDGDQANADACRCGTATCSSETGLFCTSSENTCHPLPQLPVYKERTSGNCGDVVGEGYITSPTACEAGAAALRLSDTSAYPVSRSFYPPGCSYVSSYSSSLYFNTDNSNYACSNSKKCLCTLTCQPGTYQDQLGQSTCKSCGAGKYQDQLGQTECKSCGAGTYSLPSAGSCLITCDVGYYGSSGDVSCKSCDGYSLGGSMCVTKEKFKAAYSTQSAQR